MPRATITIGLHCSHEQLPPSTLLEHARLGAVVGFTAGMCSEHYLLPAFAPRSTAVAS